MRICLIYVPKTDDKTSVQVGEVKEEDKEGDKVEVKASNST